MDIITQQIQGALDNAIFNKVNALNLNISNATLRAIVSRVAEESATYVSQNVTSSANGQLTSIPQNILGTKNPVDLVTSNLGSQGISNNLGNILNSQLNSVISQKVTTLLQKEIRNVLPASASGLINFDNLSTVLSETLSLDINKSIGTALKGFTDSIFGRGITTSGIGGNIDSLFAKSPATALTQYNQNYSSAVTNKYLSQASAFDINSETNREKLITVSQGFIDPTANYPTKEYAGGSETNKLAQGDIRGTVVQKKNTNRMKGAKLPGGEAWDEPESPFRGIYPYNKVTQTESGHIIELDDTPGAERLHVYHKSGTFIEIDNNGSVVKRTKGSSYEIIDRNGKIAISGSADVSVNGSCNIFVGNDANIEVEGDTNITCYNDITAQAGGKLNLSAKEDINITSTNVNIQAYSTMNFTSNAALSLHSSNVINMLSNVDMQFNALGDIYTTTSKNIYNQASQQIHFKSTGNFNVDGENVYLNSGTASSSKNSFIGGVSQIGILSGRKDVTDNSLNDPVALTIASSFALRLEEEPQVSGEYKAQKDLILTSGFATSDEFDAQPIVDTTDSITSSQSRFIAGSSVLKDKTALPGNFNLSKNFTLEMLSDKASITQSQITGDENISYGEIVFNLQQIALNVLEPAFNLYPNLVVVSGYRSKDISSQNSSHPKGEAVDFIFQGFTADEVYEASKLLAKNLNYDQFILEYCNYTTAPWIHITLKSTANRKQIMTFWNNKKYTDGLAKLL